MPTQGLDSSVKIGALEIDNRIPDPANSWPMLKEAVHMVLHKAGIDVARLMMWSPQELVLCRYLTADVCQVQIRIPSIERIQSSWHKQWLIDLMMLIQQPHVSLEVFNADVRRVHPVDWQLEGVSSLVVIESTIDPISTPHRKWLLERIADPLIVRIDPLNGDVMRFVVDNERSSP